MDRRCCSSAAKKISWADVSFNEQIDTPRWKQQTSSGKGNTELDCIIVKVDDAVKLWDRQGESQDDEAFALLKVSIVDLTLSPGGCRVAQKAFDVASSAHRTSLALELHGHVRKVARSPSGNHVLQKFIALLPPSQVLFIVEEFKGVGLQTAKHRFGVRVLQRLIEHCPCDMLEFLVGEILADGAKLVRHPFGNFFVQHVLEYGTLAQQTQIVCVLLADLAHLCGHKIASNVVGRALEHCNANHRQTLLHELARDGDRLKRLSKSQYGSFVVRLAFGKTKIANQI